MLFPKKCIFMIHFLLCLYYKKDPGTDSGVGYNVILTTAGRKDPVMSCLACHPGFILSGHLQFIAYVSTMLGTGTGSPYTEPVVTSH